MRRILVLLFILLFIAPPLVSLSQTDPLAGRHILRNRLQFGSFTAGDATPPEAQVSDIAYYPGVGDSLTNGPVFTFPDSLWQYSYYPSLYDYDYAAADLYGDSFDEVISAWFDADSSIAVAISSVEPIYHTWTVHTTWRIPRSELYYVNGKQYAVHLRIVTGEFDGDSHKEFLLAYITADSTLRMRLYDTDDGVTFISRAEVAEQKIFVDVMMSGDDLPGRSEWVQRFDVAPNDLDHDGTDEVVLVGVEPDGASTGRGFIKAYDFNAGSNVFIPRGKSTFFPGTTYLHHRIKAVVGEFDTTSGKECAIGWRIFGYPNNPKLFLARISEDLLTISLGGTTVEFEDDMDYCFNLACGDLNYDDVEEIILCRWDAMQVFRSAGDLSLILTCGVSPASFGGSSPGFWMDRKHRIVVADVNSDSSSRWGPEILVSAYDVVSNVLRFGLATYEPVLDSTLAITGLSRTFVERVNQEYIGVFAGKFDRAGSLRLGLPTMYARSNIVQPLVIVNAPPVHFDVFGGTEYDVAGMWDGTPGDFVATYRKQSSTTTEVTTEITRDWAQSVSLKFGFAKYGVGVDAEMGNRTSHGWSDKYDTSRTIKIGVKVDAIADDYIYATVSNYNIWEYPVYVDDDLIGHLLVVDPQSATLQHSWFPSKDWSANSYVPNHEVGNVLSYQQYSNLQDNPSLDELLRTSETFALGASSSYEYYLDYGYFQSTSSSKTKSQNTGYALGGDLFVVSFGGGEEYNDGDITTHTTTVQSDLHISSRLGSLNMGLGEVAYDVTAYTYWAKSGALVLDYAVSPDLSGPGGTPTWWQVNYNKQDPAFILPWRYDDPWKGLTLQDPAKRFQTKEITFHPFDAGRGDTVLIVARVRNFGLVNTEVPISVSFYHGDPDSGGTLLVGTDGRTKVTTAALLASRSWTTVQFPWRVPLEIQQFPRIYAKINPDTVMDEIHTNNNKGWAVFNLSSLPVGVSDGPGLPKEFSLSQNYPNPFNPTTLVRYQLPEASDVRLAIYDLLGREIMVLVNERQTPGEHEVRFDARGFSSGVYFYRLNAGGFVQARKMALVK